MIKKILIVVESIDVNDSSGSKANVALIQSLAAAGYDLIVYHYTRKEIVLPGVTCLAIKESRFNPMYFLSRIQRVIQRNSKINLAPFFESRFGFSFTFFNDVASIRRALRRYSGQADLILTLSKGASFRPHYAVLKEPKLHKKWMAYIHDPYPFHFYPRPYNWVEPGHRQKENFFKKLSEKATFSAFPSKLLMEWMGSYFPKFIDTGVVIPHQVNAEPYSAAELPTWFDDSKFNLLHAGNLMKQRSPEFLINGFEQFLKRNPNAKKHSSLIFAGSSSYHRNLLLGAGKKIPELFVYDKVLDFDRMFKVQQNTSVNIILEANTEISPFLPGKFPHCIAANKPILLLAPYYSESRRLLGSDYSYWSQADDPNRISDLIENLYNMWKLNRNSMSLNRTDLHEYLSSKTLKKTLESLFI